MKKYKIFIFVLLIILLCSCDQPKDKYFPILSNEDDDGKFQ